MDCPKCGVYNPEDRENCWRCGTELPKQAPAPKRDSQSKARMWLYIGVTLFILVSMLRMCGISVPGLPAPAEPTGRSSQRPPLVYVAPAANWL
jgi:rRNA maturation protein Nop10